LGKHKLSTSSTSYSTHLVTPRKSERRIPFLNPEYPEAGRKVKNGSVVFVCANPSVAREFRENPGGMVWCDVREALGEKYVEEVYQALG
jgi:hypothetical protein